jgi:hypothetical protein
MTWISKLPNPKLSQSRHKPSEPKGDEVANEPADHVTSNVGTEISKFPKPTKFKWW